MPVMRRCLVCRSAILSYDIHIYISPSAHNSFESVLPPLRNIIFPYFYPLYPRYRSPRSRVHFKFRTDFLAGAINCVDKGRARNSILGSNFPTSLSIHLISTFWKAGSPFDRISLQRFDFATTTDDTLPRQFLEEKWHRWSRSIQRKELGYPRWMERGIVSSRYSRLFVELTA